jgi:hypothetical protein
MNKVGTCWNNGDTCQPRATAGTWWSRAIANGDYHPVDLKRLGPLSSLVDKMPPYSPMREIEFKEALAFFLHFLLFSLYNASSSCCWMWLS